MIGADFISKSVLELRIKGLERRLESFTSGSAYQKLHDELRSANHTINSLHAEIEQIRRQNISNIKKWMEVNEDVTREKERELAGKDAQIEKLKQKIWKLENDLADMKAEKQKALEEKYEAQVALQNEKDKMTALLAQLNRNSKNSSKPSSTDPNHPKIPNTREKTGKNPGGQPGHPGHKRPTFKPTEPIVEIPPKEEFLDPSRFTPTGKIISKQLVSARLVIMVTEYHTPEYRNVKTGQRVHADFPAGLVNEVTYDGSVKALAYMLNNVCNVSIDLTSQFIKEASNGKLNLSKGFINNLNAEFSKLSDKERMEAFKALASADVFHIDFTFGRCEGRTRTVSVTCDENGNVLYQDREAKGHKGVQGTPAEVNQGVCVSDHEAALVTLGSKHQECLHHVQRYVQGSIENEPNLTWNKAMKEVLKKISHYRHSMAPDAELDPLVVQELEKAFRQALETGKQEYEDNPPTDYYRDGFNLWKRMYSKPEDYLLTLHDRSVPPDNDICERSARKYKRKIHEVMGFRSAATHEQYCDGLSVVESLKAKGEDLLPQMTEIFNRSNSDPVR